jgi:hypothetical protein
VVGKAEGEAEKVPETPAEKYSLWLNGIFEDAW